MGRIDFWPCKARIASVSPIVMEGLDFEASRISNFPCLQSMDGRLLHKMELLGFSLKSKIPSKQ